MSFSSADGARLAGQVDWPPDRVEPPFVFILHHSGPVDRDAYQYLAARLVPAGYAVFRFDKRGNGQSAGTYGCCEADDAVAAYRAGVMQGGYDPTRVYIVAQSLGTEILAQRFDDFEAIHLPRGAVLLSSLLTDEQILNVRVPVHIIVSDSEPELRSITEAATRAHRAAYPFGADFDVIPNTEHTLFDISAGPMDWSDPRWPRRFHPDAWASLLNWLDSH